MSRTHKSSLQTPETSMTSYRDAGVNIDAGEEVVDRIKPLVRKTFTPGVLTDIGAFGAFYQPDFSEYQHPILVSSVDGVGTKLKVAFQAGVHDTVGQDLVNHCVNDIAVCGARPLYFMDYFATGHLDPDVAVQIIAGFSIACVENGCALIGGETAEMPDLYSTGEYDLAGTIVGVVEKDLIVDGARIEAGDLLFGFRSTGLHTNGYSLARKVLFDRYGIDEKPPELDGRSLGEVLLDVHRSYLTVIQALLAAGVDVRGMAHVTGGGIPGNTARILRNGLEAAVDYEAWDLPPIFELIQAAGNISSLEMRRTFNLGIGLIIVVPADDTTRVMDLCSKIDEKPIEIGHIVNSDLR